MNCYGNNKNRENEKHNPMKHMLMMVFCCGLPFIIVGALSFINVGTGFKAAISGIAPFICPIMMVLMMGMMFKGNKHGNCCSKKKGVNESQNKIE
ncbi:hypothetical protein [Clostridium saccharobutylicum]|uniref:DUF2933 domain-containing protein n=1 Tax=Clostridium saccharobutylicum DSM 13864 TaxID=1345695 RepID=U5MUH1_CLOSA|nr:hypothetical protein [Clostridium saccharobutylicum]AGX43311.1 hypothetical protein CLSA_c23370 [Clostridium saccharobutylicum DSM 13864]AQR90610.1 hypothetical protein CLOSC_23310 [Clostridium saccharobutylicum]AQS00514.1 hypothetical protein CSACC_23380 [Clostridium saccharobutylicum]AQS10166.1 hypothetical protein CLOBY_23090 [Clostridium saccharobutylicum]AQS14497.1 hypothetical protein CLOSACC_23380 [Clostridium saccharobutylicum]